ncbi:MAG: hypothetical protein IJY01_00415 [Clostridia bacterium]|nr:hypothetical protein [Clostridia bacterium]
MANNTISVFYYDNDEWIEVAGDNGRLAMPLTFGNMADDRLDELRLVIMSSPVECFKPTTPFLVYMGTLEGEDATGRYRTFTMGIDNSVEMPIGSGLYRHDITLYEPTKLLEGIPCQTITFTNNNGEVNPISSEAPIVASSYSSAFDSVWGFDPIVKAVDGGFSSGVLTPNAGLYLDIPTPYEMALKIYPYIKTDNSIGIRTFASYDSSDYDESQGLAPTYNSAIKINGVSVIPNGGQAPIDNGPDGTTVEYIIPYALEEAFTATPTRANRVLYFSYKVTRSGTVLPAYPYTVTSMTVRCLELAEPITTLDGLAMGLPRIQLEGVNYTEGRVDGPVEYEEGSQAALYNDVIADELALTQANLREQLNAIGHLIHAQVRAYYKVDIHIAGEDVIVINGAPELFVRYDKYSSMARASFPSSTSNIFYRGLSQSINEYCTALRANASNIVNIYKYGDASIDDPLASGAGFKTLRTDNTNFRLEEGNALATTQEAIYKITKVIAGIIENKGNNIFDWSKVDEAGNVIARADITDRVLERADYELKDNYLETGKCRYIYYTQGEPNLNGLFFKRANTSIGTTVDDFAIIKILKQKLGPGTIYNATDIYQRIVFQVSYVPIYSAMISHGKQRYEDNAVPYEQIYNQTENVIESRYFGENIKGASARLGNVQREATFISKVNDFDELPKAGDMMPLATNEKDYSIAAVTALLYPNFVKYTLALSKDYQRINEYVGISSHKRVYEVSEREAFKRNILLKQKVLISTDKDTSDIGAFAKAPDFVRALAQVNEDMSSYAHFITGVAASGAGKFGDKAGADIILPVVSSVFGNNVTFAWKYKDNYSAGQRLTYYEDESNEGVSGFWAEEVPYSDYFGRIYKYKFSLFNLYGYAGQDDRHGYEDIANVGHLPYTFPEMDVAPSTRTIRGIYLIRKDSREAINNVTLQFEYVTDNDNIIVGSGFPFSCDLVNRDTNPQGAQLYFLDEPLGKFDTSIAGKQIRTNTDSFIFAEDAGRNNASVTVYIADPMTLEGAKAWCFAIPTSTEVHTFDDNGVEKRVTLTTGGDILFGGNFSPNFPPATFLRAKFYFTIQK